MKKQRRRGNGERSIFQRADGRWTATITIGYDAAGKRKTVYGKTKREAQEKLTRLQNQKLDNTLSDTAKLRVAKYLDRWLCDSAQLTVAETTYERYAGIVKNHIKPHIGGVKLEKLMPAHVQAI